MQKFYVKKKKIKNLSARGLAIEVLSRIEEESAYSDIVLVKALAENPLSVEDKRLATMLVLGVLRYRNQLDWLLQQVSNRPLDVLSSQVRAILRCAAYQLFLLTRIPIPAIINEAVNLAHQYAHQGVAGYVNAVLRQLKRQKDKNLNLKQPETGGLSEEGGDPVISLAVSLAHPEWMIKRWVHRFGQEETEKLGEANNRQPGLCIRLNTLKLPIKDAVNLLKHELKELTPSGIISEGFFLKGPRPLMASPFYQQGLFDIQDLSSMLIAHVLDPQPGEIILDSCAGRGGKTSHLAQWMRNEGRLLALDPLFNKLRLLQENSQRLGLMIIQAIAGDILASPLGEQKFDRVLVDAPCSSLGIIRRHPEIKWLKKESDLRELSDLQLMILENSSHLVKSNGILVYSVCSFEPEETAQVVNKFLEQNPAFVIEDIKRCIPEVLYPAVGPEGFLYIYPHQYEMDGFFIARLRKIG